MINVSELNIPRGIGISKRVFVAMAIVLSVMTVLFIYFIHHYSTHRRIVQKNADTHSMVVDTDVTNMISTLEKHKYDKGKNAAVNNQKTMQSSVPALSDNLLKTAGDSALSVYHSADAQSPDVSNTINSDSGSSAPVIPDMQQSQQGHYEAQNGQSQKIAFLQSTSSNPDTIDSQLKTPVSKYEIMAGTLIPATLVTGINSDLPGTITAKVCRDVYDTVSGNYLLIPQGTTIIGAYDSKVTYGQSRVLIAWQRLIFPNGDSFNLSGMPGADLMGAAGLSDLVDHHYTRVFGSALLMSVFGAAGQLTQPKDSNANQINNEQIIYAAIGQQLSQTSTQLIAKNMNIQPTLMIRPGENFNVLLTRDMVLPTYYHFS